MTDEKYACSGCGIVYTHNTVHHPKCPNSGIHLDGLMRIKEANDPTGAGKQTNPKDLVGSKKVPLSTLPWRVLWRVGLAMLEGMVKYGRHNYRVAGVRNSVYFDSTMRHVGAWWEGEDIDPDSGFHHLDKAIAGLMVLRDAQLSDMVTDDRPPAREENFKALDAEAKRIVESHTDKSPRHWTIMDEQPTKIQGPRFDVWIGHDGSSAPEWLPEGHTLDYKMRDHGPDQFTTTGSSANLRWDHRGWGGDIVSYRVRS